MKTTRRIVQFAALAVVVYGVFIAEGHAEKWCPFGGVEALYTYYTQGSMICSLAISNLYMLVGLLAVTLLFRRAFCGYLCPIGTISEWLQGGAGRLGIKAIQIPYRLDRTLALLKYAVLAIILWLTWQAGELYFRAADPCYALISRHGEDITFWAYIVVGAIVFGSLLLTMPFCRWFCPLAAVFNPFSRFGLARVKRDSDTCVNCQKCTQACPMAIPVDQLKQVTAARCMSCLNCLDVCPAIKKNALLWGPPRPIRRSWPQALLVGVLLVALTGVVYASYAFPIASFIKTRGTAQAKTASVDLKLSNLTCRGKATMLVYYLERDDELAISGYLKIEAWPGPGLADARITYDPTATDTDAIRQAIVEPYYDDTSHIWRPSPFEIQGYDPLAVLEKTKKSP